MTVEKVQQGAPVMESFALVFIFNAVFRVCHALISFFLIFLKILLGYHVLHSAEEWVFTQ